MKKCIGALIALALFQIACGRDESMKVANVWRQRSRRGSRRGKSEQKKTYLKKKTVTNDRKLIMAIQGNMVHKKVLSNGMTILVRSVHNIPKVSLQVWYKVGSKDEKTGEKGIAHLIEHMIFKGTDTLSESDINVLTHKLSGSTNAFTSYDYTGYLFNFPTHHWQEALPVLADTMQNAAFKDDHLNSEMKVVIQELKMYNDNYEMTLFENLITSIFPDHPYHYPIIGYKQDLWNVHGQDLKKFYKKHYTPNNATLVVVGDVQPDEVFKLSEQHFSSIPANPDYQKEEFYHNKDISAKSVTIYRDVKQPFAVQTFVVPGIKNRKEHILEIASWVLGSGKSSRLYKKIVNELKLATSLATSYWDLFDHGLFFVMYEPKKVADIPKIETAIKEEIQDIIQNGLKEEELTRAIKKTQMHLYSVMEDTEKQAYEIGKYYLATGDENYIFTYLADSPEVLSQEVQQLLASYFRPSVAHKGFVLALPEQEKAEWKKLQEESDEQDKRILSARKRDTAIEPASYANTISVKDPTHFSYPKAQTIILKNGLKILYHQNESTPKINLALRFKARPFYDPIDKQGLYGFVADMLSEGTEKYSATELADAIESRGMALSTYAGGISMHMLSDDLEYGLKLLEEVVSRPRFDKDEIEKVREQVLAEIKNFWDEPNTFASQLIRDRLYEGHPYSKNSLGKKEVIEALGRDDLIDFYKKYISPQGATLAIVGDLKDRNLQDILERTIGVWQGPEVEDIDFPPLPDDVADEKNHPINRDQVVLAYAGRSIGRKHPDFDKLFLFDQIFGSGTLGSMSSRLFALREQTGLFYTINGSLTAYASEQPGMVLVKTIVSLDRLKEAEKVIKETINTVADTIKQDEFEEAKNAIINSIMYNFESNGSIARSFLFLDRYKFPADFFDNRAQDLEKISLEDIKQAAKKVMDTSKMFTLRVGRVDSAEKV